MKTWYENLLDETITMRMSTFGRERHFIPNIDVEIFDEIFFHLENILEDVRDNRVDFEDINNSEEFLDEITEYLTESVAQNTDKDWDFIKEVFKKITDEAWVEVLNHKFIEVK